MQGQKGGMDTPYSIVHHGLYEIILSIHKLSRTRSARDATYIQSSFVSKVSK